MDGTSTRRSVSIRTAAALLTGVAASSVLMTSTSARQQEPTFRAAVELIAVDVQVVDRSGQPIASIKPDKFSVTIDGHQRRVVSVDLVRHEDGGVRPGSASEQRDRSQVTNGL
jgi:hypothetical protein